MKNRSRKTKKKILSDFFILFLDMKTALYHKDNARKVSKLNKNQDQLVLENRG